MGDFDLTPCSNSLCLSSKLFPWGRLAQPLVESAMVHKQNKVTVKMMSNI